MKLLKSLDSASPKTLRLGALVLILVTIHQLDDPLLDSTLSEEIIYWLVRNVVLVIGLWAGDKLVDRYAGQRWNSPPWLKPVVLVTAVSMLPLALAEILIEPYLPMRPEFVDDDLWAYSPILAFLSEYATLLTIVIPIHLILWLIIDRNATRDSPADDNETLTPPEFLGRTSFVQVTDVMALQAEEHYVRVYSTESEEMILYRFGDAIKEMPTNLGLQVHRSWWVAGSAVLSAKRGARRWQLNLVNDVSVPVSDTFVKAVRDQGWLKRKAAAKG